MPQLVLLQSNILHTLLADKSAEAHKLKGVLQNIKKNEQESSRLPLAFQKQVL